MIRRIAIWLRSLGAWREVRNTGLWRYEENQVTGQRRAIILGRWQPVDIDWLSSGSKPGLLFGANGVKRVWNEPSSQPARTGPMPRPSR